MERVYKEGTTSDEIILDGWSRGFKIEQTLMELQAQGFMITKEEVLASWIKLDEQYAEWVWVC